MKEEQEMKCYIVKDLLSNYIDGQNHSETNVEIKKHLENCPACRSVYEKMSTSISLGSIEKNKKIDFFKKLKMTMLKKNIMIAVFICGIIIGFCIFAKNYRIELPFDSERMSVETFRAAVVPDKNGDIFWVGLEELDFSETKDFIEGNLKEIDLIQLTYKGISDIAGKPHSGRTVQQNGENIRIVYYCYQKTLLDSLLFWKDSVLPYESGAVYGSFLYGDGYESIDYKPQKIEIYYLQFGNPENLDALTDEEFVALKKEAHFVWSGVG